MSRIPSMDGIRLRDGVGSGGERFRSGGHLPACLARTVFFPVFLTFCYHVSAFSTRSSLFLIQTKHGLFCFASALQVLWLVTARPFFLMGSLCPVSHEHPPLGATEPISDSANRPYTHSSCHHGDWSQTACGIHGGIGTQGCGVWQTRG